MDVGPFHKCNIGVYRIDVNPGPVIFYAWECVLSKILRDVRASFFEFFSYS